LEFEGLFRIVSGDVIRKLGAWSPDAPDFEAWRSIFANYLIVTRAQVSGGTLDVDIHVYALDSGQTVLTQRFSGATDNPRFFAHTLSDAFMSKTQYEGVARTRLAFTSDRDGDFRTKEIYVADYDGHRVRRVTKHDSISILPEWGPDGKRVVYTSYVDRVPEIVVADLEGGAGHSVTKRKGQSFAPSWSPDGTSIAYASNRDGRMTIWVAAADGSGPHPVTTGPGQDTAPTWSSTGREIAFTSDRSGSPQIWVIGAEGLNLRRLTRIGGHNDAPAWSPSKLYSEIAYTSLLEPGRFDIAVLDLSSGQVRQITTEFASCESPSWAPSGRHLVFACNRGGTWQLAVADRLGRQVRSLPMGPGNNAQPDWGPFR
jgi:TolB protein